MTIIEKIEAIVATMTTAVTSAGDWTWYTMESEELNRDDDAVFPFVHLDRPLRWTGRVKTGFNEIDYALSVFFGGALMELDQAQKDREANMENMRKASREFVTKLAASGFTVLDYSAFEGYNAMDMNCDGVWLNVKVRLNESAC